MAPGSLLGTVTSDSYAGMSSSIMSTVDVVGASSFANSGTVALVTVDGEFHLDFTFDPDQAGGRLTIYNLDLPANQEFEITWA